MNNYRSFTLNTNQNIIVEFTDERIIPDSGLEPSAVLDSLDAEKLFGISCAEKPKPTACRCGDVICGRIAPEQCPMFGGRCTPEDPVGPCMVSSEGACAAAYKYAGV